MSIIEGGANFFQFIRDRLADFPSLLTQDEFLNLQSHLIESGIGFNIGPGSLVSSILGLYPSELILSQLIQFLGPNAPQYTTMLTVRDMPPRDPIARIPPPDIHFDFFLQFLPAWGELLKYQFVPMRLLNDEVLVAIADTASPPQYDREIRDIVSGVLNANYNINYCLTLQYRIKDFYEGIEYLLGFGYNDCLQNNPKRYKFEDILNKKYQDLWIDLPHNQYHNTLSERGESILDDFRGDVCRLVLRGGGTRIIVGILRSLETILTCSQNPSDNYISIICNLAPFLIRCFYRLYIPFPGLHYFGYRFYNKKRREYSRDDTRKEILSDMADFDEVVNDDYSEAMTSLGRIAPGACIIHPSYSSIIISRIYRDYLDKKWFILCISRYPINAPIPLNGPFQWRSLAHLQSLMYLSHNDIRVQLITNISQDIHEFKNRFSDKQMHKMIIILLAGIKLISYHDYMFFGKREDDLLLFDSLVMKFHKQFSMLTPIIGLLGRAKTLSGHPFRRSLYFQYTKGIINHLYTSGMREIPYDISEIVTFIKRSEVSMIYLE